MIQINGTNERQYQINCQVNNICVIRCLSGQACTKLELYCAGKCYVECDIHGGDIDCPVNYGYTYTYSVDNQSRMGSDAGYGNSENNNNKRVEKATVDIVTAISVTLVILICMGCMAFLNVYNLKHAINDRHDGQGDNDEKVGRQPKISGNVNERKDENDLNAEPLPDIVYDSNANDDDSDDNDNESLYEGVGKLEHGSTPMSPKSPA